MADPLSTLGAAAAVLQLIQICISTGKAAKQLYDSFYEAPHELHRVLRKLALLEIRIKQIQDLGVEGSDIDMNDLFPEMHRTFLLGELESNRLSLAKMGSLLNHCEGHDGLGMRIRWATVDKKRAMNIMREIAETERSLDMSINILNTRILTLTYTSLGALRVGQNSLLPALDTYSKGIKSSIDVASRVLLQGETFENFRQEYNSEVVLQKSSFDLIQKMQSLQMAQLEELRVELGLFKKRNKTLKLSSNSDAIFPKDLSSAQPIKIPTSEKGVGQTMLGKQVVSSNHRVYNLNEYASNPVAVAYEVWRSGDELRYLRYSKDQCSAPSKSRSRFSSTLTIRSRKHSRKIQMVLAMALRIFGPQILRLEFNIQQLARTWANFPWVDCGITIINVRPNNWPIFRAIEHGDLQSVRHLIQNREASVNDIRENGWSILEHALVFTPRRVADAMMSLFGFAMQFGYLDTSRLLLISGADLMQVKHPALCLNSRPGGKKILEEQIAMLYGLGFTDLGPYQHLLQRAVMSGSVAAMVLAIKHYGQDPSVLSLSSTDLQTSIGIACSQNDFRTCQALLELGADPHHQFLKFRRWRASKNSTYWNCSDYFVEDGEKSLDLDESTFLYGYETSFHSIRYDVHGIPSEFGSLHWLLLQGVNTRSELPKSIHKQSIWAGLFPYGHFKFQYFEGAFLHLLLHETDPFDIHSESENFSSSYSKSWPPPSKTLIVPAILITHAWNYPQDPILTSNSYLFYGLNKMYEDQVPPPKSAYTATGWIQMNDPLFEYDEPMHSNSDQFERVTLFYRIISTEQGRRHMESFPLTRALYNALILAGYRATIDHDGDILFEDEDGDRYVDAREHQPAEAEDDGVVANCPICQDPAKYGLSHIWEEAESGKVLAQEELRKYYKTQRTEM